MPSQVGRNLLSRVALRCKVPGALSSLFVQLQFPLLDFLRSTAAAAHMRSSTSASASAQQLYTAAQENFMQLYTGSSQIVVTFSPTRSSGALDILLDQGFLTQRAVVLSSRIQALGTARIVLKV